jgi:hypothetical protein
MPSLAGLSISQKRPQGNRSEKVHVLRENLPFCSSPSGPSIIDGYDDCVFTEFWIHEELAMRFWRWRWTRSPVPHSCFQPLLCRFRLNFVAFLWSRKLLVCRFGYLRFPARWRKRVSCARFLRSQVEKFETCQQCWN